MKVQQRMLSEITPYPNNPRVNDHAVDAVAASIQEFRSASRSSWTSRT